MNKVPEDDSRYEPIQDDNQTQQPNIGQLGLSQIDKVKKKEPVVLVYDNPQAVPEDQGSVFIFFLLKLGFLVILEKWVLGIIAINSFDKQPIDLTPMFIAILVINLIHILTIWHHLAKYETPEITFEKFLLMQIVNLVTNLIFFMVWLKMIPSYSLIISYTIYALFLLIFTVILKRGDQSRPTLLFLEAIQYILISVKLQNQNFNPEWIQIVFYYRVLYWFANAFLWILAIGVCLHILYSLCSRERQQRSFVVIVYFVLFQVVFYMIAYIYLFTSCLTMLENQTLSLNPKTDKEIPQKFFTAAWMYAIGGGINLLIFVVFGYFLKQHIVQLYKKGKAGKIQEVMFEQDLNVNMQTNDNGYFTKEDIEQGRESNIQPEDATKEAANCNICFDKQNEVLLQPCNHSGFCKDCIVECLKHKVDCPVCRSQIEKIILIYYDKNKKKYLARGQIVFDKNQFNYFNLLFLYACIKLCMQLRSLEMLFSKNNLFWIQYQVSQNSFFSFVFSISLVLICFIVSKLFNLLLFLILLYLFSFFFDIYFFKIIHLLFIIQIKKNKTLSIIQFNQNTTI